ncbi:MAG TPA: hypothetical protein VMN57_02325 [Anaerolineales bacterium]|nr:hypothetical protein [Anaerolineales bacterium]
MGLIRWILPIIVITLSLALPAAVAAKGHEDEIVAGGEFVVGEEDVLDDDLLVIGGTVEIRPGGRVAGDVTQIGGTLTIHGSVDGDIRQVGGTLVLEDGAAILGDVITNGGTLVHSEQAEVAGEVGPGGSSKPVRMSGEGPWGIGRTIGDGFWSLFKIFSMAALAVVVGMLWPRQLAVAGETIAGNPVLAGGAGLLTVGVVVPLVFIAAVTLVLIPLSLAGLAALGAAGVFGWIALSFEVGRRIGEAAGQDWAPGLAAGAGAILLGIIFTGVAQIPCVGWAVQAAVGLIGLGAVVLTRFGTRIDPGLLG